MNRHEKEAKTLDLMGRLHAGFFPTFTISFGLMFFYVAFVYLSNKFGAINLAIEGIGFWKFPLFSLLLGVTLLYIGKPWRYKLAFFFSCAIVYCFSQIVFPNGHGVPRGNAPRVASCQNNMKQLGLVCSVYAENTVQKAYPTMMSYGHTKFETSYGDTNVLSENFIVHCPYNNKQSHEMIRSIDNPNFSELNYWYLGYAIGNEDEMLAFFDIYKKHMADKKELSGNIEVENGKGSNGSALFIQLNNKYTEDNAPELNATFPLFIEKPENHPFPYINVLFLDGHVEFMPFSGEWPATEKTINLLREMEKLALETTRPTPETVASNDSRWH